MSGFQDDPTPVERLPKLSRKRTPEEAQTDLIIEDQQTLSRRITECERRLDRLLADYQKAEAEREQVSQDLRDAKLLWAAAIKRMKHQGAK